MKSLLTVALVVGCVAPSGEELVVHNQVVGDADCPKSECGMNTTVMHDRHFSSIHQFGDPNEAGVSLAGYLKLPPNVKRLDVDTNRLVGVDANGVQQATGQRLVGIRMRFIADGLPFDVLIKSVNDDLRYWSTGDSTPIESYTLVYAPPGGLGTSQEKTLCKSEPTLGMLLESDAVVFEGDLYDAPTKDVDVDPDPFWFNIGCLGGAPAKMFLMRHAFASSGPGVETKEEQRQALLNAWTGNYCGDGRSFTFTGQKVRFRDANKWIDHESGWSWVNEVNQQHPQVTSYEAIWNEHGAVCLDVPRLADTKPRTYSEIQAHCRLVRGTEIPRCTKDKENVLPANWETRGHILTANPIGS